MRQGVRLQLADDTRQVDGPGDCQHGQLCTHVTVCYVECYLIAAHQQSNAAIPLIVVVSGPSGVGKDTLLERMEELHSSLNFHFVVTATTRDPRSGERDGVNHHFLDREQFQDLIRDDALLEWAEVYDNYYGVPKAQVADALAAGKHVFVRVDVQGAARIRTLVPEALFVMVLPPDGSRVCLPPLPTPAPSPTKRTGI